MPDFHFQVKDLTGAGKMVTVEAADEAAARTTLARQGFTIDSVAQPEAKPSKPLWLKLLVLLVLLAGAAWYAYFEVYLPPDVEERLLAADLAYNAGETDLLFHDLDWTVHFRGDGIRFRHVPKEKLVSYFTDRDIEVRRNTKRVARSSVLVERGWKGKFYVTRVRHTMARTSTTGSSTNKSEEMVYSWQRSGWTWKIKAVHLVPEKAGAVPEGSPAEPEQTQ